MIFTKRALALISGIALLLMSVAAGYSYGYVHNTLFVPGDPTTSLTNLLNAPGLFGSSVIAWIIILVADMVVAWGLYKYFATLSPVISGLTGLIRAIYSGVLTFAIYHLAVVWQMLYIDDPDESVVLILINGFESYWSMGLVLFGFHLIGLGYLSLKSITFPAWIGWLLYVAGISYSAIHGAKVLFTDAADWITWAEMILSIPMAVAEISLAIWLIWKGGKPMPEMLNPENALNYA